jgi:hypothetical protein
MGYVIFIACFAICDCNHIHAYITAFIKFDNYCVTRIIECCFKVTLAAWSPTHQRHRASTFCDSFVFLPRLKIALASQNSFEQLLAKEKHFYGVSFFGCKKMPIRCWHSQFSCRRCQKKINRVWLSLKKESFSLFFNRR